MKTNHVAKFYCSFGPGARFSKASKTFRARKAIFNYLYLKNKVVYRRENLYDGNLYSCENCVKKTAL